MNKSLEEIHKSIDDVDYFIIELLTKRQELVKKAAKFKTDEESVKDVDRVKAILGRVKAMAITSGLDPIVAVNTYRAMIHSFVGLELVEFEKEEKPDKDEASPKQTE